MKKNKFHIIPTTPFEIKKSAVIPVDIFATPEWISLFDRKKILLLGIFNNNNDLIGYFFTYQYKRKKIISQLANPPFTPHCGLSIVLPQSGVFKKNTNLKYINKALVTYLSKAKHQIKTISFPSCYSDFQDFYWNNFKVIPHYTYQLNLKLTESELLNEMSPERRKNIKKALESTIKIDLSPKKQEIVAFILKNKEKIKYNLNHQLIEKIITQFYTDKNSLLVLAKNKQNEPVGVVICVYSQQKAYYIFGHATNSLEGIKTLCIWECIKTAKAKNVSIFDFEGSMLEGVESFFRGFGGQLIPYYTINKANYLIESLLKITDKSHF